LLFASVTSVAGDAQSVSISLPTSASATVKYGATALSEAFTKSGWQVNSKNQRSTADLEVVVAETPGKGPASQKPPDKPESYSVSFSSNKHTAYVSGSDATGTMYGEFELAEQIESQAGTDWKDRLKTVSKSPFLEVRGVNMFLTAQDVDNPDGAFWSDDYWDKYLGIMARSRYNFLDIHGLCDRSHCRFLMGSHSSSACRISRKLA